MDKNPSYSPVITLGDLPPNGPYVSFEKSIGASLQTGEVVDIDYSALQKTADTIGLRSEIFAKTAITLCGKTSTAILNKKSNQGSASYNEEDGIGRVSCRLDKGYDRIFRHELAHIRDLSEGAKSMAIDKRYIIGKCALYSATPIYAGSIGLFAAHTAYFFSELNLNLPISSYGYEYALEMALYVGDRTGIGLLLANLAGGLWGYTFHPLERSARNAEKLDTPNIVYNINPQGEQQYLT